MTSRGARVFALALTVGVAVLAGLFTGTVAGKTADCDTSTSEQRPNGDEKKNSEDNQPGGDNENQTDPFEDNEEQPGDLPGGGGNAAAAAQLADGSNEDCGGFSWPVAGAGFAGALLAGLLVWYVLPKDGSPTSVISSPPSTPTAPNQAVSAGTGTFPVLPDPIHEPPTQMLTPRDDSETSAQRRALIDALIYVRDRATSPAIADRVRADLAAAGVTEIAPQGSAFDPAHHEAGGFVGTNDANLVGRIAAVETVGYTDNATVIRPPVVTVYRAGS